MLLNCIDVEIAAAEIYKTFMRMFPEEGDFWGRLALEEEDHARLYLVGDLLDLTGRHPAFRLPHPALISRTMAFAEQVREEISTRPITLKEALELALKLEKSVTESIVFELPESDNPIIANVRKIITDTEAHVDRIERLRLEKGFTFPA